MSAAWDKAVPRPLAWQPAVTFSGILFRTKEPRSRREDNQGTHVWRGVQNKPERDGRSQVAGERESKCPGLDFRCSSVELFLRRVFLKCVLFMLPHGDSGSTA